MAAVMVLTAFSGCGKKVEESPEQPVGSSDPIVSDIPETTTEPVTTMPETTTEPVTTPETTTAPETTPAPTTTEATTTEAVKTTSKDGFTVEEMSATMYTTMSLNVRKGPSTEFDRIGALAEGDEITVTGRASTGWYRISFNGGDGYVSNIYVTSEKPAVTRAPETTPAAPTSSDEVEDYNEDEETEDVDDGTGYTAPQTTTQPSNPDIYNLGDLGWVKDNACEYMYNLFTEQRYKDALTKLANAVKNLVPAISLEEYLTHDEALIFAEKIAHIVGTGYCYFDRVTSISSNGATLYLSYYVNTIEEAQTMQANLENMASRIVANCASYSAYNKVKYIYEYLCRNVKYGGRYEGSTYGSVVDGGATCLGYAKGTFYLLSKAGLDVVYDVGVGLGEGSGSMHAWVKVNIGGKWYCVDTGWGAPSGSEAEDPTYVNYDFLCVTDTFMKNTRREVFDLTRFYNNPVANSNDLNWYVLNGCYVDTYDQAVQTLKNQLTSQLSSDDQYIYLRVQFSNEAEFMSFYNHFKLSTFQSEVVAGITSARKTNKKFCDTDNAEAAPIKKTYSIKYRLRKS